MHTWRIAASGTARSHLSPRAGRGRLASGALAKRSKSGEGAIPLARTRGHAPPPPRPPRASLPPRTDPPPPPPRGGGRSVAVPPPVPPLAHYHSTPACLFFLFP